jgi:hypothetical protein
MTNTGIEELNRILQEIAALLLTNTEKQPNLLYQLKPKPYVLMVVGKLMALVNHYYWY